MARTGKGMIKRKPARRPNLQTFQRASIVYCACCRVGLGNDIHRLAPGRKLILGGVRIPFEKGPVGHSDGDALAHAVCDALLGALALGDIGQHFPDNSPQWHKASSLVFVRRARELIEKAGYRIVNVDSTVGLERPKLGPHMAAMRRKLARALGVAPEQVSVKAKSGEALDAVGRGQAVRADAVALIVRHQGSEV
jgi:2-C-methyl-D-erythritol 2,4-cyclodiphosphate synthase